MSGYTIECGEIQGFSTFSFKTEEPETPELRLKMEDSGQGDSTETELELRFRTGSWQAVGDSSGIVIKCQGDWERAGLIELLEYAVVQLKKA